jgi:hypothetical protein
MSEMETAESDLVYQSLWNPQKARLILPEME